MLYNIGQNILHIYIYIYIYVYIFENELFPTTALKQMDHVDAVGCRTVISG
jgi:hypothetical protein